jgi:hypothetical protein
MIIFRYGKPITMDECLELVLGPYNNGQLINPSELQEKLKQAGVIFGDKPAQYAVYDVLTELVRMSRGELVNVGGRMSVLFVKSEKLKA